MWSMAHLYWLQHNLRIKNRWALVRCYGITDSFKEMQDSSLVTCQRSVYEETTDQERELQPEVSQEKRDFEVATVSSSSRDSDEKIYWGLLWREQDTVFIFQTCMTQRKRWVWQDWWWKLVTEKRWTRHSLVEDSESLLMRSSISLSAQDWLNLELYNNLNKTSTTHARETSLGRLNCR